MIDLARPFLLLAIAATAAAVPAGTAREPDPVERALAWLEKRQSEDGTWGEGHRTGTTGIVTVAYLLAGQTHGTGEHRAAVRASLKHLKLAQGEDGRFGTDDAKEDLRDHVWAALAMAEAYARTGSPLFERSVARSVAYTLKARTVGGVWGRTPRSDEGDVEVTAWAILGLRAARVVKAEVEIPDGVFERAMRWLERRTDGWSGLVDGDVDGRRRTAAGLAIRFYADEDGGEGDVFARGVARCLERTPAWRDGRSDPAAALLFSMAAFEIGGRGSRTDLAWRRGFLGPVVEAQRREGELAGSWDPGARAEAPGRAATTALHAAALAMRAYHHRSLAWSRW